MRRSFKDSSSDGDGSTSTAKALALHAATVQKEMVSSVARLGDTVKALARLETQRDIDRLEDKLMDLEMRRCDLDDEDRRAILIDKNIDRIKRSIASLKGNEAVEDK